MKSKRIAIDTAAVGLISNAAVNGDMLSIDEMMRLSEYDFDDDAVKEILSILADNAVSFYRNYFLNDESIKSLDKKIKESCEDERKAVTGAENSVVLYLKETARLERLDSTTERELLYEIEDGSEDAKNRLIEGCLYIPVMAAEKYIGKGVLFLDLVQEGNLVLMTEADSWTDTRLSFSAFCAWKICRMMEKMTQASEQPLKIPASQAEDFSKAVSAYRKMLSEGKKPSLDDIAAETGLSEEKVKKLVSLINKNDDEEDDEAGAEKTEEERIMSAQVAQMLAVLSPEEAKLIKLKFGLENEKPLSADEISEKLGMTIEETEKLEQSAMKHLGGQNG